VRDLVEPALYVSLGGAVVKRAIHKSHRMGKSFTDVRAPAGTPRFYGVRQCKGCGGEEIEHAAGQFTDYDLVKPCHARRKS
jgi:hypothetical protein